MNASLAKSINSTFRILLNFNVKALELLLTVYIQNRGVTSELGAYIQSKMWLRIYINIYDYSNMG